MYISLHPDNFSTSALSSHPPVPDADHPPVADPHLLRRESWDASRLAGPIAVVVNASRASWAAKQASMDAKEGLGKVADSISSMASTDEDSNQIYRDPADPTKVGKCSEWQCA